MISPEESESDLPNEMVDTRTRRASISVRLLRRLSSAIYRHPRLFLYPQAVLLLAAILFTFKNLEFSTNRSDLVGADKRYHQNFLRFRQEFSAQDDLVAVVESEQREKNRQFVERLGAKLEAETNLFTGVFYKGDLQMLGGKALFFLSPETLDELHSSLERFQPFLEKFATASNLNSLFRLVNAQFRSSSRDSADESMLQALPALHRIAEQAAANVPRLGTPPSPGISALFGAGEEAEQEQYITFDHGRIYIATAHARSDELNKRAIARLTELVQQTQAEIPGVNVGVTGEPILEIAEMEQSQRDSIRATLVALVLVAAIFIYGYHETGRPLKATICLVVGLGFTLGYTTLAVGHLNILTITFVPILVGLAIDFGIHLITRYEEELRHDASDQTALDRAIVNTGAGIFTGCFTTAGAFFAMAITDFKGIQEMGIITGGGMLICLIPMLTLLPVLLLLGRQNVIDHALAHRRVERRARIERLWLERPALVLGATLILSALALVKLPSVRFDYNLLNMQSKGLPAVVFEKKLVATASKSVLFAAVTAESIEEAIRLENQLNQLPSVASVDSVAQFLAENPAPKMGKIGQIQQIAQSIAFVPTHDAPVDLPELRQTLQYTLAYLNLASAMLKDEPDQAELLDQVRALREAILRLREMTSSTHARRAVPQLTAYQQALFDDLHRTFNLLSSQDPSAGLAISDLPENLRNRFIGRTGKFLLQVYPHKNVWERDAQEEFVRELRTIDPDVTGTPVQLYEYTTLLRESYEKAAWYALGAIAVLVFIHFRSVLNVFLALIPVLIGSLWMVGIMGWFNIPFNPANIMTLPLVIGIGVTNGIHILNRFTEEQNPSILAKSTGKAVLVSGLTTIAGFGSLIQADHQGIASLGMVMVAGVATCMVVALTFLPTILNLLIRCGWAFKKPSGDNALSTLGREEPR